MKAQKYHVMPNNRSATAYSLEKRYHTYSPLTKQKKLMSKKNMFLQLLIWYGIGMILPLLVEHGVKVLCEVIVFCFGSVKSMFSVKSMWPIVWNKSQTSDVSDWLGMRPDSWAGSTYICICVCICVFVFACLYLCICIVSDWLGMRLDSWTDSTRNNWKHPNWYW